jgi:hypothetical protein
MAMWLAAGARADATTRDDREPPTFGLGKGGATMYQVFVYPITPSLWHWEGQFGPGWVGFDFATAFGRPAKVVNNAVMHALGSYEEVGCSFSDWAPTSGQR